MKEEIRKILERWFMASDFRMNSAVEALYELLQDKLKNDNAANK